MGWGLDWYGKDYFFWLSNSWIILGEARLDLGESGCGMARLGVVRFYMHYMSEEYIEMGMSRWIPDEELNTTLENFDVIKHELSRLGFKLALLEKNGQKRELSHEEFHIVMLYLRTYGSYLGRGKRRITLEKMKKRLGIDEEKTNSS